jgi:hypothetical protein
MIKIDCLDGWLEERQNKMATADNHRAANESRAAKLTALFRGSIVDFFCAGLHRRGVFEAAGYCALIFASVRSLIYASS